MAPLAVPWSFAAAGLNTPTTRLDDNNDAIEAYVNARAPASGPVASRPAAGNAGALWVATDQDNRLYLDTGAAWVAVPSSTAGDNEVLFGTSTGGYESHPNLTFSIGSGVLTTPNLIVNGGNLSVNGGTATMTKATGFGVVINCGANNGASIPLYVRDAAGINVKFAVSDDPTNPVSITANGLGRALGLGAANSGGAGFRLVIVSN